MKKTIFSNIGIVLLLLFSILTSCTDTTKQKNSVQVNANDTLNFAFPTKLKYAKGFTVVNHKNYKEVAVTHPLTDSIMATYILTLSRTNLPDSIKNKGQVVQVPAKTIACLSTTHLGAVSLLGLRDKVIGCGSPEYVWDEKLQKRIKEGKIIEIGRGMGFNIEKIVSLTPDVLMQNFMDKTDVDGNLKRLGVTVLYNNEWKEHSLLARAEWLKFTALFFCKERQADSIFNQIDKNYNEVKAIAQTAKKRGAVMYGYDHKGMWYLPQNDTYVAQTIRDANAEFRGAGDGNSSIPKSFEEIYALFHDSEVWLTMQGKVRTMQEFLNSNERYIDFKAAQNKQVYSNNKREKLTGGNDYWESGTSRPDLLLKDLVKILHPELFPDYETIYWQHLK